METEKKGAMSPRKKYPKQKKAEVVEEREASLLVKGLEYETLSTWREGGEKNFGGKGNIEEGWKKKWKRSERKGVGEEIKALIGERREIDRDSHVRILEVLLGSKNCRVTR